MAISAKVSSTIQITEEQERYFHYLLYLPTYYKR